MPAVALEPLTAKTASHIDAVIETEKEDDTGLPPRLFDDDGGRYKGCEWPFDLCYEKGICQLSPTINYDTGIPDNPYFLCLRHYTVWLERIADGLGDSTSRMHFTTGQQLANLVFSRIKYWDEGTGGIDAPETGVEHFSVSDLANASISVPAAPLEKDLNENVILNPLRDEEEDDYPDEPIRIGWSPVILDAVRKKIDDYVSADNSTSSHHFLFSHRTKNKPYDDYTAMLIIRTVFQPILESSHTTQEALERINAVNLDEDFTR